MQRDSLSSSKKQLLENVHDFLLVNVITDFDNDIYLFSSDLLSVKFQTV